MSTNTIRRARPGFILISAGALEISGAEDFGAATVGGGDFATFGAGGGGVMTAGGGGGVMTAGGGGAAVFKLATGDGGGATFGCITGGFGFGAFTNFTGAGFVAGFVFVFLDASAGSDF